MALTLKLEVELPPADYPTLPYHMLVGDATTAVMGRRGVFVGQGQEKYKPPPKKNKQKQKLSTTSSK